MPIDKKIKLKPKRDKFVQNYAETGNATQSAIAANYSPRSARQSASRLLTKDDIQASLTERKEAAAQKAGFTLDWQYEMLKKAADLALLPTHNQYGITSNADVRGLVAVMDIKNKMNGHYEAVKSEISTEVNNDGLKELVNELKKDH